MTLEQIDNDSQIEKPVLLKTNDDSPEYFLFRGPMTINSITWYTGLRAMKTPNGYNLSGATAIYKGNIDIWEIVNE